MRELATLQKNNINRLCNSSDRRVFDSYRGGIAVSKASKRRTAVGANRSRVTELSILAVGATLLAPYAIAQEQDAAASKEQGEQATSKSDDAITEVLVTG